MNGKSLRLMCVFALLVAATACSSPNKPVQAAGPPRVLVIRNGTLIDGTGAEPIPNGAVIVQGERILAVGREADLEVPAGAQIIDAGGGTILPGLIDSHVHSAWRPEIRRQFMELGVTAVCDLGSPIERMVEFEQEPWDGKGVARGFRAGPILTAPGGLPGAVLGQGLNYEVGTPEQARRVVDDLAGRGADVIKVYLDEMGNDGSFPMLSEATLKAIVEQTHQRDLLVRAHVTDLYLAPMAIECGVDVVEHLPKPFLSEEQIVSELQDSQDPLGDLFDMVVDPEYEALLPRMAAQGIVMVPTLAVAYGRWYGLEEATPAERVVSDAVVEVVGRFRRAGGVIALGTDYAADAADRSPDMFRREMLLLHAAGLTPVQAIEAATKNAARVCGHGEDLGTLEAGKLADILVVDGDAATDLGALENVTTVVVGGRIAVSTP